MIEYWWLYEEEKGLGLVVIPVILAPRCRGRKSVSLRPAWDISDILFQKQASRQAGRQASRETMPKVHR